MSNEEKALCLEPLKSASFNAVGQVAVDLEARVELFLKRNLSAPDPANSAAVGVDAGPLNILKQQLFEASRKLEELCEKNAFSRGMLNPLARNLQECIDGLRVYLIRGNFGRGIAFSSYRELVNTLEAFATEVDAIAQESLICGEESIMRREPVVLKRIT